MEKEKELRIHRCCFTGHRPEKLQCTEAAAKEILEIVIRQAVDNGFRTFITGMARGVDIWAGQIVLLLRGMNYDVKLVAASPYKGFETTWSPEWQRQYNHLIKWADAVRYISPEYSKNVFQKRNEWMVDRSNLVIAFYTGKSGGTRNTIEYASEHGVEIVNLADRLYLRSYDSTLN